MFNVHDISHFCRDGFRFALMNRSWTSLRQGAHETKVKSIKQNACVIALSMTSEEPCKNLTSLTRQVIELKFSSLPAFAHVKLSNSPHLEVRWSFLSLWLVAPINEDLASALRSESVWLSFPVIDIDLDAFKVTFCRKNVYLKGIQAKHIKHIVSNLNKTQFQINLTKEGFSVKSKRFWVLTMQGMIWPGKIYFTKSCSPSPFKMRTTNKKFAIIFYLYIKATHNGYSNRDHTSRGL